MTITNNFVFLIVSALGLASANGGISVKNLITQSASTEQSTNRTTSPSQRESAANGMDAHHTMSRPATHMVAANGPEQSARLSRGEG